MAETIIQLTPLIIGSAVVPLQIMMIILLLNSPRQGLFKAICLVAGMTAVRLVQGVIFGLILSPEPGDTSGKSPVVFHTAPCFGYSPAHHGVQAVA